MKKALRDYLISDSDLFDLVGTGIYSYPVPQSASKPYLMIQRITETANRNLNSASERYRELWQIDIFASTDLESEEIKNLVRNRLDICQPITIGGWDVFNIYFESSDELSELENDAGQSAIIRKALTFVIIRQKSK